MRKRAIIGNEERIIGCMKIETEEDLSFLRKRQLQTAQACQYQRRLKLTKTNSIFNPEALIHSESLSTSVENADQNWVEGAQEHNDFSTQNADDEFNGEHETNATVRYYDCREESELDLASEFIDSLEEYEALFAEPVDDWTGEDEDQPAPVLASSHQMPADVPCDMQETDIAEAFTLGLSPPDG